MKSIAIFGLFSAALAHPTPAESQVTGIPLNNLTSPYTLTAYAPWNKLYHGAKINNQNFFQEKVGSYCPPQVGDACPKGVDQVWLGSLYPSSLVPGGQDSYVAADGQLLITVQHSHSFPSGSYPSYYGWKWNALPVYQPRTLPGCPANNPKYNCAAPTGVFTYKLDDAKTGGVWACPNKYSPVTMSVYAVTPSFNSTGCIPLLGLGTHTYTGVNPPVWAY